LTLKVTVSFFGRSHSITSPEMCTEPSAARSTNAPPTRSSTSTARPPKYCLENSACVSACHTFSGVAPM
jgi:hypothetical protein